MKNSKISWTDDTSNPIQVVGGGSYCQKVSAGCKHCYAERVNKMVCGFQGVKPYDYKVYDDAEMPQLMLREDILLKWAKLGRPRRIFVASMTDVFAEFVKDEWVFKMLDAMATAWKQTFQVLTKRSGRARDLIDAWCISRGWSSLPKNIWIIVSVENQEALYRAKDLISTKCHVRGLSIEPMIGEINLCESQTLTMANDQVVMHTTIAEHIQWVIVGGESGGQARMMNPAWVYILKDQCESHKVPFFFKQWGEWVGGDLNQKSGRMSLQDGGMCDINSGYLWHEWGPYRKGDLFNFFSVRVGKKVRQIRSTVDSDNALLDAEYVQQMPPYYTEPEKIKVKR